MDISSSFHDPALCRALLDRLSEELEALGRPVRFMEVCGTHTVSIFRSCCLRGWSIFQGRDVRCA